MAELDDDEAKDKQDRLREYLGLILRERDPKTQRIAAGMAGASRTTLERYRRIWPEIEDEVKREIKAGINKVRKV